VGNGTLERYQERGYEWPQELCKAFEVVLRLSLPSIPYYSTLLFVLPQPRSSYHHTHPRQSEPQISFLPSAISPLCPTPQIRPLGAASTSFLFPVLNNLRSNSSCKNFSHGALNTICSHLRFLTPCLNAGSWQPRCWVVHGSFFFFLATARNSTGSKERRFLVHHILFAAGIGVMGAGQAKGEGYH
jgi:hypothetical protein